jgi:succinoglycan biosynthesis transport protein ExoP
LRGEHVPEIRSLADYLRVIRRGKWVLLLSILVGVATALSLSLRQESLYRATAEVLLNQESVASRLTGIDDPNMQDPVRFAETQVDIARAPALAQRVKRQTGIDIDLLERSRVRARPDSNVLEFAVTHPKRQSAALLANKYADQYTRYRRELDTAALRRARGDLLREIERVRDAGGEGTPLFERLLEEARELRTLVALQTSNAVVIRLARARQAKQVQPRPVRAGLLGAALGLFLGLAIIFLADVLETRVRTAEEATAALGVPLLGRILAPKRFARKRTGLVMLSEADRPGAEAFRMLRTNLEFAKLERDVKTIVVTSAIEEEGKTTTAANLGVALARTGRRVVLVDLDLRRPALAQMFGLDGQTGLTDVALGRMSLEDAIRAVSVSGPDLDGRAAAPASRTNGRGPVASTLEILPSGPLPPDAGEFITTQALARILGSLRDRADIVLIDTPPVLHVGDAIALSSRVDAILLVARLGTVRRPMLAEARRLLESSPAPVLGYVLTGIRQADGYGYGGYYGYRTARESQTVDAP